MGNDGGRLAAAALCALSVCLGCPPKEPLERFGLRGGGVILEPEMLPGPGLSDITWKKGEDLVAEGGQPPWFAPHLEGRAQLDSAKGSLTLGKLQPSDSGQYRAEVGDEFQCTFFSLRILEPPQPPQFNCTEIGGRIWVTCEPDATDEAANTSLTYRWEYQRGNKQIPGSSSEIWLEKDGDLLEDVTCIIRVLDANASSSIALRGCASTGAAVHPRDRAFLLVPFAVFLTAGMAFYFWRTGCFSPKRRGKLNWKCKEKTQEWEEGTAAAEARPEAQRLHEERSENLEEENSKGPPDPGT